MKIFVTGGTGFLGSHFLKTALDAGVEVRALRRAGSKPRIPLAHEPDWIETGLGEAQADWFDGVDVLVHLAAAGVSPQKVTWSDAHQVNVADSMRLCESAFESGIRNFVICGTCMEYGAAAESYEFIPADAPLQPSGPYATSKAAFFTSVRAFCFDKACSLSYLRPFHFFGDGQFEQNLWPSLRKAALAGEDFPMTLGEQIRDFIPVEAVATRFLKEAIRLGTAGIASCKLQAGTSGTGVESCKLQVETGKADPQPAARNPQLIRVANVGTGRPQSLRQFAEHWWKEWGAKGQLKIGAIPYRENEVMRYVPDVSPLPFS